MELTKSPSRSARLAVSPGIKAAEALSSLLVCEIKIGWSYTYIPSSLCNAIQGQRVPIHGLNGPTIMSVQLIELLFSGCIITEACSAPVPSFKQRELVVMIFYF